MNNGNGNQKKQRMGSTIIDIAEKTGLSRSTVSRVINNSPQVSDRARELVLAVIEDIGYIPNMIARGLRSEPNIIGVVMQDILNPYYIEALYEIEKICKSNGYALLHMNSDNDPRIESENLYQLLSMKVKGIILLANMLDEKDKMTKLAMRSSKMITLEGRIKGVDCVISNPRKSIVEMVDYLYECGHRKYGLAHHRMRSYPIIEREKIFINCLKDRGIKVSSKHVFYGDDYIKQIDEAHENNDFPSLIFALNDSTAFYIYKWCRDNGIVIPDDLSVVGFDNVKTYEMMMPSLTTIHQPIGKLAEKATNMLFERIENDKQETHKTNLKPKIIRIDTKFLMRDSVGPPRLG